MVNYKMAKPLKKSECGRVKSGIPAKFMGRGCCSLPFSVSLNAIDDFRRDVQKAMKNERELPSKNLTFKEVRSLYRNINDKTYKNIENADKKGAYNIKITEKNFWKGRKEKMWSGVDKPPNPSTDWWWACKKEALEDQSGIHCVMQACTNIRELYEKHEILLPGIGEF
jgi:hypothetical protein